MGEQFQSSWTTFFSPTIIMFEDKWGSQIGCSIDSVAYGDPRGQVFLNVFVAFNFLILGKRTSGSNPE